MKEHADGLVVSPVVERRASEREREETIRWISARQELLPTGSVLSLNPPRIVLQCLVRSVTPAEDPQEQRRRPIDVLQCRSLSLPRLLLTFVGVSPDDVNWFKPIE